MSPLNKPRPGGRRRSRRPRWPVTAAPPSEPSAPPPAAEVAPVPITFDGHHLGDLHVRPGTDPLLLARALDQIVTRTEWSKLGADLAAHGPHRLAIAARAATAAASGGRGVSAEEEDSVAQWFAGIVDEAIRRGGVRAAVAIWVVLMADSHANPFDVRPARCPVVAEVPEPPSGCASDPGEPGGATPAPAEVAAFLAKLRAAAPGYVHTTIACASDSDMRALRKLVRADDDALDAYRPWGVDLAGEVAAAESLESACSMLTCRRLSNAEACSGLGNWAYGFAGMVSEHAIPPVFRIGAIAWLARVALRPDERAALVRSAQEDAR